MRSLSGLAPVAGGYDAVVLDQWGVLHDGARPYAGAADAVMRLAAATRLAMLSNSGKRAAPNLERIARLGVPDRFHTVMTSGEALWRDVRDGHAAMAAPLVLAAREEDADAWAEGLPVARTSDPEAADAVVLMGLPEPADTGRATADVLAAARRRGLVVHCSNPDRAAPRAGGRVVRSPGALAAEHEAAGGTVRWYGKPHRPVFDALRRALELPAAARILMVGDSPEHDVAGAKAAGWDAALVAGGLHAARLAGGEPEAVRALCAEEGAPEPDLVLPALRW
jgi:HAD superfamily hydrolase (TIGR01459 family)